MLITATQAALDGGDTVKRLLLFTRVAPDEDSQPVDLVKMMCAGAQLTAPRWRDAAQVEGRPISLTVEAEGDPTIQGSPPQLRELMTNLIFNAVDAMPVAGTIRLRAVADDGQGIVEIIDSGQAPAWVWPWCWGSWNGTVGTSRSFGLGLGTTFRMIFPLVTAFAGPAPTPAPTIQLGPSRPLRSPCSGR